MLSIATRNNTDPVVHREEPEHLPSARTLTFYRHHLAWVEREEQLLWLRRIEARHGIQHQSCTLLINLSSGSLILVYKLHWVDRLHWVEPLDWVLTFCRKLSARWEGRLVGRARTMECAVSVLTLWAPCYRVSWHNHRSIYSSFLQNWTRSHHTQTIYRLPCNRKIKLGQ